MTSDRQYVIWSVLATLLVGLLLGGFETSLWPMLFGFLPTPLSWFCVIVYMAHHRSRVEGFTTAYIYGIAISVYTSAPAGILVFLSALAFIGIRAVRTRIYWPGVGYFVLVCTLGVPAFHVCHHLVSWLVEARAVTEVPVFRWVGEMGTTAIVAAGLYHVLGFLDHMIRPEQGAEESMGTTE